MATKYVKFAPENKAAAEAYATFTEAGIAAKGSNYANALLSWPRRYEETFGPDHQAGDLFRDTNLNWVVAWFGPPFVFNGQLQQPLAGDDDARALGVLVDTPDWFSFD